MNIRDTFDKPYRTVTREEAQTGDVASWEDVRGYTRAFVMLGASTGPMYLHAHKPSGEDVYQPIPQGARFKRLLPDNPPAVALTHGQWQLVIDALADSADAWIDAAASERVHRNGDGRAAEEAAADISNTMRAIKRQLGAA